MNTADLVLRQMGAPASVNRGTTYSYTQTIANHGTFTATTAPVTSLKYVHARYGASTRSVELEIKP